MALNFNIHISHAACIEKALPWICLLKADQKMNDKTLFPWNCSITDLSVLFLALLIPVRENGLVTFLFSETDKQDSHPQCTFVLPFFRNDHGSAWDLDWSCTSGADCGQCSCLSPLHCESLGKHHWLLAWHCHHSRPLRPPVSSSKCLWEHTKTSYREAGDVSLIPCHIQLDECEQDFLGISDAGAEAMTLLQTMLSIFAAFAAPPQCDTRISLRSFAGGTKPVEQLGGTWPPFVVARGWFTVYRALVRKAQFTPPERLHLVLGSPAQKRHRPIKAEPEEGHKNGQKVGGLLLWILAERVGFVQTEERKFQRELIELIAAFQYKKGFF